MLSKSEVLPTQILQDCAAPGKISENQIKSFNFMIVQFTDFCFTKKHELQGPPVC